MNGRGCAVGNGVMRSGQRGSFAAICGPAPVALGLVNSDRRALVGTRQIGLAVGKPPSRPPIGGSVRPTGRRLPPGRPAPASHFIWGGGRMGGHPWRGTPLGYAGDQQQQNNAETKSTMVRQSLAGRPRSTHLPKEGWGYKCPMGCAKTESGYASVVGRCEWTVVGHQPMPFDGNPKAFRLALNGS